MKIILANGTELNPYTAKGGSKFVQNANRDCLTFSFPADAGLEAIDAAFTSLACENITIIDDSNDAFIHKGYTIRAELSKKSVEIVPATVDTEAVYEDRIIVAMAQRTYAETQMKEMQTALAALAGKGE